MKPSAFPIEDCYHGRARNQYKRFKSLAEASIKCPARGQAQPQEQAVVRGAAKWKKGRPLFEQHGFVSVSHSFGFCANYIPFCLSLSLSPSLSLLLELPSHGMHLGVYAGQGCRYVCVCMQCMYPFEKPDKRGPSLTGRLIEILPLCLLMILVSQV